MTAPSEKALTVCRAALRRGPLIKARTNHWRYRGRRMFNAETVIALIESGEAIRNGDQILSNMMPVESSE